MKILIDIGHPAHVHYFKHLIKRLSENNKVLVIARNKEVALNLLSSYNISYINRGKGGKGFIGKITYLFYANIFILYYSLKFKPDYFLSFSTVYPAHVAFLLRKKYIGMTDTEHSVEQINLFRPFSHKILTPSCFMKDLGKKQIRFDSYMELAYLHPNLFTPDPSVKEDLKLKSNEKYIIVRFVAWQASHDIRGKGFSLEYKREMIRKLNKYGRVFISSENILPSEFEAYRLDLAPNRFHDVLAFADLYIGEGATTASECAVLGIPNIYVNSLVVGYCKEQAEKYNLCYHFISQEGVIEKAIQILTDPKIKQKFQDRKREMLKDKIDLTAFMVWFIENYPESVKIVKRNPNYQLNFK